MALRVLFLAASLVCTAALAQQAATDPYTEVNKQVQQKLRELGFYEGPVNGAFGFYTQAALAQFQLARLLPASGMLDKETQAALGVEFEASASTGASAPPQPGEQAQPAEQAKRAE
jgi:peptidoglycan hydrolase-like protein with peptidoglycan-binding domain